MALDGGVHDGVDVLVNALRGHRHPEDDMNRGPALALELSAARTPLGASPWPPHTPPPMGVRGGLPPGA